ncbi:hypothetical protein HYU96_01360 [Candidatus Daviesbacteria bacterium]|nr:hypothetical protein [Candidatus Daviesbacteria bacterium]
MATERVNNCARKFEGALRLVPDQDKVLVDALIRPLESATAFFRAQRAEGFYGSLTLGDDLPENGDSPHTIIRSNGEDRVYGYREIEPYRRYLRDIARRMEDAVGVANDINDPEKDLIEASLRPRALALREGKFTEAMILGLNTRLNPRYHLFVGLLDRYLDPRGLKLVMQGWLQRVRPEENRYFNDLAHQITRSNIPGFRVIYGDMLAAGGMTVDKSWNGNTIPSEDDIRKQVGADSYLFSNNMDESTKEVDIPAVRLYIPQVVQVSDWEETMLRAKKKAFTAHETGHAEMPFDGETIKLLGGRYMAIKELLAELFAVTEIAKLPRSVISFSMKQLIYARSLAVWRNGIDKYLQETDPDKKAILEHYAWAGVWRTNHQEREGGVRMSENGMMSVPDWDRFVELDGDLSRELLSAINHERYERGFVDRVIGFNSRIPREYIDTNGNGNYDSLVGTSLG